jgi:hypothetical protein
MSQTERAGVLSGRANYTKGMGGFHLSMEAMCLLLD